MLRFEGEIERLWSLGGMQPIQHLTWDWWWWLIMLEDEKHPNRSRQLMVLWSTKNTEVIDVGGSEWQGGRPRADEEGGLSIPGMVAAWWFDGERMWEPLVKKSLRMAAIPTSHSLWPGEEGVAGSGAIIPIDEHDLSMGLGAKGDEFWLNLTADESLQKDGCSANFAFRMRPWSKPMSTARWAHKDYGKGMGYDILRLHGALVQGDIDGTPVTGTAYFQKVCVQAPSPPWYWGMLHASDGTYIDWFLPHVAATITAKDARPWKMRDLPHHPLSQSGLLHDAKNGRSEIFEQVRVRKLPSRKLEGKHAEWPIAPLPIFEVEMWNGRTTVLIEAQAIARAHWTFDQPTRGRMTSHLTYNEYPLQVLKLSITDENGRRNLDDFAWVRGNAEHSWGILH